MCCVCCVCCVCFVRCTLYAVRYVLSVVCAADKFSEQEGMLVHLPKKKAQRVFKVGRVRCDMMYAVLCWNAYCAVCCDMSVLCSVTCNVLCVISPLSCVVSCVCCVLCSRDRETRNTHVCAVRAVRAVYAVRCV